MLALVADENVVGVIWLASPFVTHTSNLSTDSTYAEIAFPSRRRELEANTIPVHTIAATIIK